MDELFTSRGLFIVAMFYITIFLAFFGYCQFVVYQWLKQVYEVTPKLMGIQRRIFNNEATVKDAEFLIDPSSVIKFDKIIYFKIGVFWKYRRIFEYVNNFQQFTSIAKDLKIHVDPDATKIQKDYATSMWMIKDYCHKSLAWMINFGFSIRGIERVLIITGISFILSSLGCLCFFIIV